MGLWVQFVAVGRGRQLGDDPRLMALGGAGEWQFARVADDVGFDVFDAVGNLASTLDAPVLGAYVADSDAAALYFAPPEGRVDFLAINPAYDESDDADDAHTQQWVDPAQHRAAAQDLSEWAARYAPSKPSADEIIETLTSLADDDLSREVGLPTLVFAEDGLRVIFDELLGIASLDQVVLGPGPISSSHQAVHGPGREGDYAHLADQSWNPRLAVTVPTPELALSLSEKLFAFPGGMGIFRGENGIPMPGRFEVGLHEFPTNPAQLAQALRAVQKWINEVDLDEVKVRAAGSEHTVTRQRNT